MEARTWSRVALVVVSAGVLQLGVASRFRVADVGADLLLLAAVAAAMVVGADRGAVTGFACGILVDLLTHGPFGLTALTFALTAYGIGRFEAAIVRSSRATLMATGFFGTALGHVLYSLLGDLVGVSSRGPTAIARIALIAAVWNGVLTPLAVRAMRWAWREPSGLRIGFR